MRVLLLALVPFALSGCQPPWSVDGAVLDGARATTHASGTMVFEPLDGAKVEFRCPHGELPTQTLYTNGYSNAGRFSFSGKGTHFPTTCEIEISKAGYATYSDTFAAFCPGKSDCRRATVSVVLKPVGVGPPSASGSAATPATASVTAPPCASASAASSAKASSIPRGSARPPDPLDPFNKL
jgi:hypothetical protein